MSGNLVKVCLIGPAKIGARWIRQGEQDVTADEKLALEAVGLILPDDLDVETAAALIATSGASAVAIPKTTEINFDDAFNAAVSAEANKIAGQTLDDIVEDANREKAELLARIDDLNYAFTAERQKSADLAEKLTTAVAEIAALKAALAKTDTPQSESVAKTAPKKAAATTTKG